jgi:hypothetical protein
LDHIRGKDGGKQIMNSLLGGGIAGVVLGAKCVYPNCFFGRIISS